MKEKLPSQKDLAVIREKISALDRNGMELLRQRLSFASEIGRFKQQTGSSILDTSREAVVIHEAQKHFDPSMDNRIESVMNTVMRLSRESQYEILMEQDTVWEPGAQIRSAADSIPVPVRVSCQGPAGSYSCLAAAKIFPHSELRPAQTFDEACAMVLCGDCDLAILPLENTTAGTVNDVVDLLATEPLFICQAFSVPIRHKLMLLPGSGLKDIRTVVSHPQALAQCAKFIKKQGWTAKAVESTAYAAQRLAEGKDASVCAIASEEAALRYGLAVSVESICDSVHNQTRFVATGKTLTITDGAERISITFHLAHQKGSLAFVLNLFAERGLNLTKIQSRPVPDRPWEYSFWVDLVSKKGNADAMLAMYQLARELPFLKLMGWYEETIVEV